MQDRTYYILADVMDVRSAAGTAVVYPGETDLELPEEMGELWRPTDQAAPAPDTPELARQDVRACPPGAALSRPEHAEASAAYERLCEEFKAAHDDLLQAEAAFTEARRAWGAAVSAAYARYAPVQGTLKSRMWEYREQHRAAAEQTRQEAEAAEAQHQAALDAQYGPREWVVLRHTWSNAADNVAGLPLARRPEDCRPAVHTARCVVVTEQRRPTIPGTNITDWQAEPRKMLREGAVLARLPDVLEAMAQGGPSGYQSQGKVWANRAAPRRPARLCGRCRVLPKLVKAMGEEAWKAWQEENPRFNY